MADRTLRAIITGDSAGAVRAFEKSSLAADESAHAMGDSMEAGTSRVGGLFQKLGTKMSSWGLPFGEAVASVGEKFSEAETKGQKFSQAMSTIGAATVAAAGVGIAAIGAESIHLAIGFDTATSKIAASAGVSQAAAKQIGDAFLSTAGDTTYTATELAQAYSGVAAQLGATQGHALSAAQALNVMKAANDLAEGSGTDLTAATTTLAAVMQAYGMKAKDAGEASDILYSASKRAGVPVTMLGQSLARMHSQLGAVTPALKTTSALIVELAQHGETGRQSVSAVSSAMQSLLKTATTAASAQQMANQALKQLPTSLQGMAQGYLNGSLSVTQLTKATRNLTSTNATLLKNFMTEATKVTKANATYKELGLQLTKTTGKFIGMSSVIDQLHKKTEGMTQAQTLAYLTTAVGATSARKLLSVVEAGPAAFQKATDAVSKTGAAHKAAEAATNNLKDQLEKLKVVGEDLGVKFGDVLIPKIELLGRVLMSGITWLEKHKAAALALAGVIGGALSAAVAVFAVNKIGHMIHSVQGAVKTLQGFGKSAANLAGKLTSSSEEAAAGVAEANATIEASTAEMADSVQASSEEAGAGIEGIATTTEAAAPEMDAASSSMFGPIGLAIAGVVMVATLLVTHWKQVSHALSAVWGGIKEAASVVWSGIKSVFHDFLGFIEHWGPLIGEAVLAPFTGGMSLILPQIIKHWGSIESFFRSMPGKVKRALADAGTWLLDIGKKILEGLLHGIQHGVGAVVDGVKKVGSSILNTFKSIFSIFSPSRVFHNLGLNLMQGLALGIGDGGGTSVKALQGVAGQIAAVQMRTQQVASGGVATPGAATAPMSAPSVGAPSVTVIANTNATPHQIANEVGWQMRTWR